ncbi:MAG: TonB-dependent receptor [Methylococcales bacterium]|nr:TonB-dependent receptor [Methylococcales bacterium]
MSYLKISVSTILFLCMLYTSALRAESAAENDLSLEELVNTEIAAATQKEKVKKKMLNMKVSSVSKTSQSVSNAAAAVFVIDSEAIKRSGVTSVPEALRMAPGIDVARINNSKWAITARGFNGHIANKLLVLIDGRSVYTPDFSGVYWDAQDVMLEDVERIEVIRGPGATLWGANAMNGVINIITKHTEDTQGGLLTAGAGSKETGFGALRYGTQWGEDTFARAYAKGFLREEFTAEQANNGNADWQQFQGGFRLDSTLSTQDTLMLQGNAYAGDPNETLDIFTSPVPISDMSKINGWNLTSRLNHSLSSTADYSLQFYYDHYQRQEYIINGERDTLDVDFQNTFALTEEQSVIWGLGYRYSNDAFKGKTLTTFYPNAANTQLFSAFAQDEVSFLDDALLLTIGSKFEHNDYTGFEIQPSASLMWTPVTGHKFWTSISRSVRTPSRVEDNSKLAIGVPPPFSAHNPLPIPVNLVVVGNPAYKAEQQLSYQLGYRLMFNHNVSWDITAFYNDYRSLRAMSFGNASFIQGAVEQSVMLNNISTGNTYGFEMSGVWQMFDGWRWDLNYSLLKTELNHLDQYPPTHSPEHMTSLRAALNPIEKVNLDVWLRYSSSATALSMRQLAFVAINGYVTMDVRLAYQPVDHVELSVTGQNLLESQHLEYIDDGFVLPSGVPRTVYGKISWAF